jgi:hypothetical protein
MFIAATGVIEIPVLLPIGMNRAPTITPILALQLYSTAGAKPSDQLAPEFSWISNERVLPLASVA